MLCATCKVDKSETEFYRHYYVKQDGTRSFMVNCKSCLQQRHLDWYHEVPNRRQQETRKYTLRKYGLSVEDFDRMEKEQDGKCAICGNPEPDGRRLSVDHNHNCCPGKESCGKCVRGLLCFQCNARIWILDSDLLEAATAYIDSFD